MKSSDHRESCKSVKSKQSGWFSYIRNVVDCSVAHMRRQEIDTVELRFNCRRFQIDAASLFTTWLNTTIVRRIKLKTNLMFSFKALEHVPKISFGMGPAVCYARNKSVCGIRNLPQPTDTLYWRRSSICPVDILSVQDLNYRPICNIFVFGNYHTWAHFHYQIRYGFSVIRHCFWVWPQIQRRWIYEKRSSLVAWKDGDGIGLQHVRPRRVTANDS